ncbi:MAG: hypothetical protein IKX36_01710 [Prevotella sp.]|nr:hypothetical protein [Prevotella sp.]
MTMTSNEQSLFGRGSVGGSLLMEAARYWNGMAQFRKQRERCKRYTYGDQWKDRVFVDGQWMTEEDYIRRQGNEPLKNNLIRRLVKNVLGHFREADDRMACTACQPEDRMAAKVMTKALQSNQRLNRSVELNARSLEEFLISGLVVQRKSFGVRQGRADCWTDCVMPDHFFIDSAMRDCRGWDVRCLGELHDIPFSALCRDFARSAADYQHLRAIYAPADYLERVALVCQAFGESSPNQDFYTSPDGLCRVVEVWRKEERERLICHDTSTGEVYKIDAANYETMIGGKDHIRTEWFIDEEWHYYFLTPFGDVLEEGASPYAHGQHPYVFKAYPFIDGEVHSFVADVIDQQRYTNRLISLYDWVMRSSAKGILLVPEECIPDGYSLDDIAEEWARFNGVIAVRARAGSVLPQQISTNATNIGIKELLQTQLDFFEDISGVSGVLQGKRESAVTSGTLFAQQTANAARSLIDILDTFRGFLIDGANKDVCNMQQYYDRPRSYWADAPSDSEKPDYLSYIPEQMRDVSFDVEIKKTA